MKKPTLKIGSRIFSPGLVSSLTTLLLIPLLVYLGFWQLHRFAEKQKIQRDLESRTNEPVMILSQTSPIHIKAKEINKIRYRQLQVTGIFLNEYPILLDNQISQGQVGYQVIIPFLPIESEQILLINRGWIPIGKNRNHLPDIPAVLGNISLTGTIDLLTSGLQFKQSALRQIHWPLRVQRIEFQALSKLFARELYPFILQLNPNNPYGFKRLPITLHTPPSRHMGYAIQWFAMAIAVFIYYLVINCYKGKLCT